MMSTSATKNEDQYIPYHAAEKLLADRLGATPEEIAAWIWDGWGDDRTKKARDIPTPAHVLQAYTNVYEQDPPPIFVFHPEEKASELVSSMAGCYFDRDELNRFTPNERYITAPALIKEIAEYTGSRKKAKALIQSRVRESMLISLHPNTGLTEWECPDSINCASKKEALFMRSQVDLLLKEFTKEVPLIRNFDHGTDADNEAIPVQTASSVNAGIRTAAQQSTKDDDIAAMFDPVTPAALEKMFPASGNWAKWHAKAKEKGLNVAREGRGKYNPYRAALWWLSERAPKGWTLGQCCKRLASNLPPRSHGLESKLTGKIEGEIE